MLFQFLTPLLSDSVPGRQDGAGWDPDARWLLCRWDMGAEDACHRPQQGRVAEGDWGNPRWRSDAQAGGETRYASEMDFFFFFF